VGFAQSSFGAPWNAAPSDQVHLVCEEACSSICRMWEVMNDEWARLTNEWARLLEWEDALHAWSGKAIAQNSIEHEVLH
jgi:hypothetical protein